MYASDEGSPVTVPFSLVSTLHCRPASVALIPCPEVVPLLLVESFCLALGPRPRSSGDDDDDESLLPVLDAASMAQAGGVDVGEGTMRVCG